MKKITSNSGSFLVFSASFAQDILKGPAAKNVKLWKAKFFQYSVLYLTIARLFTKGPHPQKTLKSGIRKVFYHRY